MSPSWFHRPLAMAALIAAAPGLSPSPTQACAPAPMHGEFVQVVDEAALVVWDSRTRTQHFIRRAAFTGARSDFGFLVPTPTVPELAEVAGDPFSLAAALETRRVVENVLHGFVFCWVLRKPSPAPTPRQTLSDVIVMEDAAAAGVSVVHRQRVAGYDAVVLEADDAGALARWLARHGFVKGAALQRWLEVYVASWPAPGAISCVAGSACRLHAAVRRCG